MVAVQIHLDHAFTRDVNVLELKAPEGGHRVGQTKNEVGYRPRPPYSHGGGIMTQYFPIIVEQESNGTVSAWVAGLPGVYAAADTVTAAKRGIRRALAAHLAALGTLGREPPLTADVTVLRRDVYATRRDSFRFVGVGALLGRGTSRAKAESSRSNGRKGGRPPEVPGRAIHARKSTDEHSRS